MRAIGHGLGFLRRQFVRPLTSTSDPAVTDDASKGYKVGDAWFNTATKNVFTLVDSTIGAAVWQHRPRVLGASNVQASHTGDTSETVLATVTVPANAMGANGILRIAALWSFTNNANQKVHRWRLGGIGGTVLFQIGGGSVSVATGQYLFDIVNRNATNVQTGNPLGSAGYSNTSTAAVPTAAVDTTAAVDLVATIALASAADTASIEKYAVELLRP